MHTWLMHARSVTSTKGSGEGHRLGQATKRRQGEGALTFCFTFRKSSTRNRLQRWMTYSLCQAERCQEPHTALRQSSAWARRRM